MPTQPSPIIQAILARALSKPTSIGPLVPDRVFGVPNRHLEARPGTPDDIMNRDVERAGLPGAEMAMRFSQPHNISGAPIGNGWTGTSTPRFAPGLINPANNPMMSAAELRRGDINLDTGEEDRHNLIQYLLAASKINKK